MKVLFGVSFISFFIMFVFAAWLAVKVTWYERAFEQIANDMQINYGLQQGTLEALKECRDADVLARH